MATPIIIFNSLEPWSIILTLTFACANAEKILPAVRVSEDALTAVSLAFPIQTLLIAVGAGTGVGINHGNHHWKGHI